MASVTATPPPARPAPARLWERIRGASAHLWTAGSVVLLILIWEFAVRLFDIHPLLLPAPSIVGAEFFEISERGLLWAPLAETMKALFVGVGLSLLVGIPLGVIIGATGLLDLLSTPYLWALRATPSIAIAPLLVIWVGFSFDAKVIMVFLSAGVMVMMITLEGVKTVDEGLVRVARSFGADRKAIYKSVVLPYIVPYIANAVRNGIGAGIVGVMVVEMFNAPGGIGAQVRRASHSYDGPRMFAYIIILILISLALIALSRRLEAYASRWREEAYV